LRRCSPRVHDRLLVSIPDKHRRRARAAFSLRLRLAVGLVIVAAAALTSGGAIAGSTSSGTLVVSVSGLPHGTAASVVVRGSGYRRAVKTSTTLSALPFGTYTVTAATVSAAGKRYSGRVDTRTVTLRSAHKRATVRVSYTAGARAALEVATTSLPAATAGVPYSVTLHARGGKPPYTWKYKSFSSLNWLFNESPADLFPPSGTISGTPVSSGTLTFTAIVSDAGGASASRTLTIKSEGGAAGKIVFDVSGLRSAATVVELSLYSLAPRSGLPTVQAQASNSQPATFDLAPGVYRLGGLNSATGFCNTGPDTCWYLPTELQLHTLPTFALAPGQTLRVPVPMQAVAVGTLVIHTTGSAGTNIGLGVTGDPGGADWEIREPFHPGDTATRQLTPGAHTVSAYRCAGPCIAQRPPRANPPAFKQLPVTITRGQVTEITVDF
jgi:hypothetical protein